jgi:histone H3/H4
MPFQPDDDDPHFVSAGTVREALAALRDGEDDATAPALQVASDVVPYLNGVLTVVGDGLVHVAENIAKSGARTTIQGDDMMRAALVVLDPALARKFMNSYQEQVDLGERAGVVSPLKLATCSKFLRSMVDASTRISAGAVSLLLLALHAVFKRAIMNGYGVAVQEGKKRMHGPDVLLNPADGTSWSLLCTMVHIDGDSWLTPEEVRASLKAAMAKPLF